MRTPGRLITWTALLVVVLVAPTPAEAVEVTGGLSVGVFQAGTIPRVAVTPHSGISWRKESGFLFAVKNNKATRSFLLLIAIFTVGFAACNYTDGECWYYGEGSENAGASAGVGPGGGVIVPTGPAGVGGFGDSPPKQPQDATNPGEPPVCNIVSLSPCHDKCDEEDEARAIECAKIQDEAQRRACNDGSHEKYMNCIKGCENAPNDICQDKFERCQLYAPFLTCSTQVGGGKTRCNLCFEDCRAGKPVSKICKKCLF